jgi:hypothetical protein
MFRHIPPSLIVYSCTLLRFRSSYLGSCGSSERSRPALFSGRMKVMTRRPSGREDFIVSDRSMSVSRSAATALMCSTRVCRDVCLK